MPSDRVRAVSSLGSCPICDVDFLHQSFAAARAGAVLVHVTTNTSYKSQDVSPKYVILFERTKKLQLLSCFQEQNTFRGLEQSLIDMLCISLLKYAHHIGLLTVQHH